MGLTCASCRYENPPAARFCGRCGVPLAPVSVGQNGASPPPGPPAPQDNMPSEGRLAAGHTAGGVLLPPPSYPHTPPPSAGPADTAQLTVVCVAGPDQGKRAAVGEQVLLLGTGLGSGLLSGDADVAPEHADLTFQYGRLYFRSHGGAPLFLDGVPTAEGVLLPGRQLRAGRSFWQLEAPAPQSHPSQSQYGPPPMPRAPRTPLMQTLGRQVADAAGVSPVEGFDAREMFSGVLTPHSDDDVEEYFLVGTATTTPPLELVKAFWPKPWVFFKMLGLSLLVYLAFVFGLQEFKNPNLLPGLIIIGSFAMPLTVVVFYFEMDVPRNVSLYQVGRAVLVGGILSLIVSLFGYTIVPNGIQAAQAGIAEELGKVAALLLFVGKPRWRWSLNGLLLGGAVGAGFAGFESAGYALRAVLETHAISPLLFSIFMRGVLAPGGHVAWAALEGAALWKVKGDQPFNFGMLFDIRFLRVLGLCMLLHTLWDFPLIPIIPMVILTVIAWLAILAFIQDGLKQVQSAQAQMPGGSHETVS